MVSSFASLLVQGPFLVVGLVLAVVFRSALSVRTYRSVVTPEIAEAVLSRKRTSLVAEDASFRGYHYWFVSLIPPYIVRAFGEKTTIITLRGRELPIESSLRPHVPEHEGKTEAEISIEVRAAGHSEAHVTYLLSFHNTSKRRVVRKGAKIMFPVGTVVKFTDYFDELHSAASIHGNQVLYNIEFREPVRPGNSYLLKIDFDALLGDVKGVWYLDINAMSDHDSMDTPIHLSVRDGLFRSITPTPRFISKNKAELLLSLPRNTTTRISMEFECG